MCIRLLGHAGQITLYVTWKNQHPKDNFARRNCVVCAPLLGVGDSCIEVAGWIAKCVRKHIGKGSVKVDQCI